MLLTKEQANDLLSGKTYMAVYGQGIYFDIFGKGHWFRHCNWTSYYSGGTYLSAGCVAYSNTGDGELPK